MNLKSKKGESPIVCIAWLFMIFGVGVILRDVFMAGKTQAEITEADTHTALNILHGETTTNTGTFEGFIACWVFLAICFGVYKFFKWLNS
jgi:hypothetical protein